MTVDKNAASAIEARLVEQALEVVNGHLLAGQVRQAEIACRGILAEFPHCADAWNRLAVIMAECGNGLQALAFLERAIELSPQEPTFHANLAEVLRRAGLPELALLRGQRAAELGPQHQVAQLNFGFALLDCGQAAQALTCFEVAAQREPTALQPRFGMARALLAQGQVAQAEEALRHCLELAPLNAEVRLALAGALRVLGQLDAACVEARLAHRYLPRHAGVVALLADILVEQGQTDDAIDILEQGLEAMPDVPSLAYRLSLLRLSQARFQEGFALYESRLRLGDSDVSNRIKTPLLPMPAWTGQDLQGKRLLVMIEQGFGDVIQFSRFVPRLAEAGAEVVLAVSPPLEDLMRSLPGCSRVVTRIDESRASGCDFWVHVASLPQRLGVDVTGIGMPEPYLQAEPLRRVWWRQRLVRCNHPRRIGLVWSGRPDNDYERRRSLPFQAFAPLAAVEGVSWVSLQLGQRAQEAAAGPSVLPIEFLTAAELGTFADTAALIAELDLLITVDTAFAHLAGALGRPAWLLLPQVADWRWSLQADGSPWYPSLRIFRQRRRDHWDEVVARVAAALPEFLSPASDAGHASTGVEP